MKSMIPVMSNIFCSIPSASGSIPRLSPRSWKMTVRTPLRNKDLLNPIELKLAKRAGNGKIIST